MSTLRCRRRWRVPLALAGLRPGATAKSGCLHISIVLEVLYEGIRNVRTVVVGDARGRAFYIFHQAVEVVAGSGDADYADGGAIPEFGAIEFGDRDVEAGPQPVFQAAHNLPTVFDRLRGFNVEFEGKKSNHAV
jgi:hypothetical protein